jgi:hypothetical protein
LPGLTEKATKIFCWLGFSKEHIAFRLESKRTGKMDFFLKHARDEVAFDP